MTFPDALFQQIVLQQGMLSTDLVLQLQTKQRELAATGEARALIEIAVSMGFMAPAWGHVMAIAQNQGWTPPDGVVPPYPWDLYKPEVPIAPTPGAVAPPASDPSAAPLAAGGPASSAAAPALGGASPTATLPAATLEGPTSAPAPAAVTEGAVSAPSASVGSAQPAPPPLPGAEPRLADPPGPAAAPAPPPPLALPAPPPLPGLAQGAASPTAPPPLASASASLASSPSGTAPVAGPPQSAPLIADGPSAAGSPQGAPVAGPSQGTPTATGPPQGALAAAGAPVRQGTGRIMKKASGTGRLSSGATRRRTRTFATPSDLGGTKSSGNAGYLALAAGGAGALILAALGAAFLFHNPKEVAQATPSATPTGTASLTKREVDRWQELARAEIRRASEELRMGDAAGGRQRLQRCMALLKEKPNSKPARLTLFEALEKFPPVEDQIPRRAATPTPTPAQTSEFTNDGPPRRRPDTPETDPEETTPKLEPEEEDLPPSIDPDPISTPTPDPLKPDGEEAPPEVRDAIGHLQAARLWLLATAAFDRSDRLGLEKIVTAIAKKSPTSVYARAGKGLLAFLHEDFTVARKALEPLHSDPKLREAAKSAGLLRPEQVLVRVAFYTKHYKLAREVATGLRDPAERRTWTLLVDGPFASEFPHLYPALTTLSPDKRYRVLSDVGITGSELDRLEAELAALKSPAKLDAQQRKIRKSHKLLATIAEVLDKAALAYGKLLSQKGGKDVFPTVYVFKDRVGFAKFGRDIGIGNTENALGYYMSDYRILVFYEETEDVKLGLSRNTVETLLHETFHQWVHLHLEDAPPWFNEGMAEYFSLGAKIGRKSLEYAVLPQRNPSRLTNIRDALRGEYAKPWTLREIMRADQRTFMMPSQAGVNYAHAWSLVHYLGATPKRRRLLRSYFQALLTGLDSRAAYTKVFGRVDMNAMEADWKNYILTVK